MPGLREEEDFKKNTAILHFLCPNYLHFGRGVINFIIFGRPFLGHHFYIRGLSDLCLGVEKKIFKEIMLFQLNGQTLKGHFQEFQNLGCSHCPVEFLGSSKELF